MFIVFWEIEDWQSKLTRDWAVAVSEHKAKGRLSEVLEKYGDSVVKHGIAKIDERNTLFDRL